MNPDLAFKLYEDLCKTMDSYDLNPSEQLSCLLGVIWYIHPGLEMTNEEISETAVKVLNKWAGKSEAT